jgi:hypothetical protein
MCRTFILVHALVKLEVIKLTSCVFFRPFGQNTNSYCSRKCRQRHCDHQGHEEQKVVPELSHISELVRFHHTLELVNNVVLNR